MPLGESMISSLKSNKSIKLDKTSRFKKTLGGYGKNKRHEFDFPKASPELLEQIKQKAQKDHKRKRLISAILFIILFCVLVYVTFYFNII